MKPLYITNDEIEQIYFALQNRIDMLAENLPFLGEKDRDEVFGWVGLMDRVLYRIEKEFPFVLKEKEL
jgi:hypothetical protein